MHVPAVIAVLLVWVSNFAISAKPASATAASFRN
jgi:hypothetical protein